MDIQIGPHLYRNSNGTIEIEGVPQIEIEPRPSGGFPNVHFALFEHGRMPAKLTNSTLAINEGQAYSLEKSLTSLVMRHQDSGREILHMTLEENGRLVLSQGEFHTLKGHVLTITPSEWTLEHTTVTEGETDLQGKAVPLA